MKISIIIPIYNVAPYVERCLYSALNQSYEDIELVLVDDCGTDNSMNIVSEVVENMWVTKYHFLSMNII